MAVYAYIESRLTGIQDPILQNLLKSVFQYLVPGITFGNAVQNTKSTNMSGGFYTGTTSATASAEFLVPHNFGRAPYLLIPVVPLNVVNAALVQLTVSRAADANNVYLKSPVVSAHIAVYLEA